MDRYADRRARTHFERLLLGEVGLLSDILLVHSVYEQN